MNTQSRERSEPSRGNAVRHAGITDRFQGEQVIKRRKRSEVDRRARDAIDQLRQGREDEREKDQRDRDDRKAEHERLRDEWRREMDTPETVIRELSPEKPKQEQRRDDETATPKDRARSSNTEHVLTEPHPEHEIETDRYGNEINGMSIPVEPEPAREEPPPLGPVRAISDQVGS